MVTAYMQQEEKALCAKVRPWLVLTVLFAAVLALLSRGHRVRAQGTLPDKLLIGAQVLVREVMGLCNIAVAPSKALYGVSPEALLFSPTSRWATVGDIFTFDLVAADPGLVTEVTMNISFDPAVLRVVNTAGNKATQIEVPSLPYMWDVITNWVDNSTGRIGYVVDGWPMSLSGTTTLGRLRFKKIRVAASTTVRYTEGSAVSYKYNPYPYTTLGSAVVTGPSDSTPPSITNIRESADPIYRQGCPGPTTVTIRADVYDASGLEWVRLSYQLPTGSWTWGFMSLESGSTYAMAIGPFASTGTITYMIIARDKAGNEASSDSGTVTIIDCTTGTLTPTRTLTR
ncbi:MAG: cohesin domain-containing protein, partial [Anaerolineae bacterium]